MPASGEERCGRCLRFESDCACPTFVEHVQAHLGVSWVRCTGTGVSHPFVTRDGALSTGCEFCRLRDRIALQQAVMRDCVGHLVEGKVIMAADVLRAHLEAAAEWTTNPLPEEKP